MCLLSDVIFVIFLNPIAYKINEYLTICFVSTRGLSQNYFYHS